MSGSGARLPPEQAYDLWPVTYDQQNDNLLMALDEELTFAGTTAADWEGRAILDFGCGTGRHWDRLPGAAPPVGGGVSPGRGATGTGSRPPPVWSASISRRGCSAGCRSATRGPRSTGSETSRCPCSP